jgi:hypothetical protein
MPGEIVVQQEAWENACRDAKRYRWLRKNQDKNALWGDPIYNLGDQLLQGDELDSAIDESMGAK